MVIKPLKLPGSKSLDYHKDQKAKNTLLNDYVFTLEESDTFN